MVILPAIRLRRRPAQTTAAPVLDRSSELQAAVSVALTMLDLLPTATALVDADDVVRLSNSAASRMGIVRDGSISIRELQSLVESARRDATTGTVDFSLQTSRFPRRTLWVGARAEPLADGTVALLVDDLTEARRVEAVRRDFVANVGHEIKTPVGALALLAEAATGARDDREALLGFVQRIGKEAQRLSRLVQELLDLSRLQGGEPLPDGSVVGIDAVLEEAVDRTRAAADLKGIELVRGGDVGLSVLGSERQLVTAVANLLDNAVAYSAAGTRVAIGVHGRPDSVEIAVSDQGIGIAAHDQERIFERFYRVDQARSRATGGTGLGLAIVKHVVSNHGGEVKVWSEPGAGSTFTLRLPTAGARSGWAPDSAPASVPAGIEADRKGLAG